LFFYYENVNKNLVYSLNFFIIVLGIFFSGYAYAVPVIPPSADITRLKNEINKQNNKIFPTVMPQISKKIIIPKDIMPKNAKKIIFKLKDLKIKGITAYKLKKFSSLWKKDIGKKITLARIYKIAERITLQYHKDGYLLSRAYVPAQTIDNSSTAKIIVTEGYVSIVDFVGDMLPQVMLDNFHEKILASRPLNNKTLEREVLVLNDFLNVRFRAVLKKEKDIIILKLIGEKVKRKPVSSIISYSNSGSRFVGPSIVSANFSFRKGFRELDKATLALSATPDSNEFRSISGSYSMPLNLEGLKVSLSGEYTTGAPGFTLTNNDVRSNTFGLGAKIIWDTIRSRTKNLHLSLGTDLENSQTDVLGTNISKDSIRSINLHADGDLQDSYNGFTTYDVTFSQGLKIVGASHSGDLNLSRARGRPDFWSIQASAYHLQNIKGPWNIQLGFSGQFANIPLLTSDQFAYGGQSFGRAYDSSEITGDKGFSIMGELRYEENIFSNKYHFEHFAFYDLGKLWNNDGASSAQSGASAGIGTRLKMPNNIKLNLTMALPLTRNVSTPQYGSGKSPRILFSTSVSL